MTHAPGSVVSTDIAPGWRANVTIEAVIFLRGKRYYIVLIREQPDCVYGIRDDGNVYPALT